MTQLPKTLVLARRPTLAPCLALVACLATSAATAQVFDPWQTAVGYGTLAATLGANTPTGGGVPIAQIEPTETGGKYYPFLESAELQAAGDPANTALIPIDGSGGAANGGSGHATNVVGRYIYGNFFGLARGADNVTVYEAGEFVNNKLLANVNMAPSAADFNYRVENNSWISLPASPLVVDQRTLRHYDYAIDAFNVTAIVGANNNDAAVPNLAHPRLLTHSLNALAVGRTDGKHSHGAAGDGKTSSDYFAGRVKPDIVAPGTLTSTTTAMVSSAATILHDRANDLPALNLASNNEVMKAILLAGATKDNNIPNPVLPTPLPGWDRTATRPLDEVYGAGQLNVWNSYRILEGGRHAGGAASPGLASSYGWDYQDLKSSAVTSMKYDFVVPVGTVASDLSIILEWNAKVAAPGSWTDTNADVSITDLNLELTASAGGVLPLGTISQSISTVDNVEHIYVPGTLIAGTYTLDVSALSGAINWDYGLAWRMNTVRLLPSADFDQDGFVDGADLIAWQQNLGTLVNATRAQGDADGDGDVDMDDLSLFNAQITPAEVIAAAMQARAAVSAIPEPGTVGLAAAAAGFFAAALRRRRRCG